MLPPDPSRSPKKQKKTKKTGLTPESLESSLESDSPEDLQSFFENLLRSLPQDSEGQSPEDIDIPGVTAKLTGFVEDAGKSAIEGLQRFQALIQDAKLLQKLRTFQEKVDTQDFEGASELIDEDDFQQLLECVNRSLSESRLPECKAMYTFLQLLQPFACEPIIGQMTALWEQHGPDYAAEQWLQLTQFYENPMLDLFAGECLLEAKQPVEALRLIDRAIVQLNQEQEEPEDDLTQELRKDLLALREQATRR